MLKKYTQAKELKIDNTILNKKSIIKNLLKRKNLDEVLKILKHYSFDNVLITKTELELMFK